MIGGMHGRQRRPIPAFNLPGHEMHRMKKIGQPVAQSQHCHQIKPETGQIHDVFFVHRAAAKHSVDATKSSQPAASSADMRQRRNGDPVVITHDHRFDLPGTMDKQADLPIELSRERS